MDARLASKSSLQRFRDSLSWVSFLAFIASFHLGIFFPRGAFAEQPLSETIRIQSFPSHTRLVFRVDDGVPVEWKETGDGFEAFFKGLGFTDLGAPLGEEDEWANQFQKSLHDPRLAAVVLREVSGGLKVFGKWKFPVGPLAPAEPKMEAFNYREHHPGEYVVDFWLKKGLTVAEAQALKKKQTHEKKLHQEKVAIQNRASRRIAAEKAQSELNRLSKFCDGPLSEKKDVFLTFSPVSEKIDYLKELPRGAADAQFPYFEPKVATKASESGQESPGAQEAQYVRLALKLYREEKYALVTRTLDFFEAEHPTSPYRQEMKFLRANALLKLNMPTEGERILSELKVEAKGKPVALYSALYLASKLLEPVEGKEFRFKDPLAAYETFSWFFTHYPDHRLVWLFHLGAAEALAAIKQTEQAAKEYNWVAENARSPEQKAQGALRLGNVYLERRELPQALEAYSRALRYFKKESEQYPAIHLNRGETLYGLGEFEEARKVFEDFNRRFSGYPHGWRATYRLGEIYGRIAGVTNEKASRQWFYDTINHFPLSAGSTLARLRLLPCGDHAGFTFDSAARFFDGEAKNFDASGEISMVRYPDYRALAQVRSYITLDQEEAAFDVAQREFSLSKNEIVKSELGRMIEELFRKNILARLEHDEPYEALSFYEEKSQFRPKDRVGVDPDYLLKLSLAASRLGLGMKAEAFAKEYRQIAGVGRSLAKEKDAGAMASQPKANSQSVSAGDLDLRLKHSEESFAEARAIWMSRDSAKEEFKADLVRSKLDQVVAESPYSFEKEVILGLLEERSGKPKTARNHALKAQVLAPTAKSAENDEMALQILAWLAGLEVKAGEPKSALSMYRDLEKKLTGRKVEDVATLAAFLGVAPVPALEKVLMNQGNLLESMKRWGETAVVYQKAMDQGLGGNQAMYGYSRALLKRGDKASREKAKATLLKLTESKADDFWKKLAEETLANLQLKKN
jgi:tetratricopeptide (TPR) repeat protein